MDSQVAPLSCASGTWSLSRGKWVDFCESPLLVCWQHISYYLVEFEIQHNCLNDNLQITCFPPSSSVKPPEKTFSQQHLCFFMFSLNLYPFSVSSRSYCYFISPWQGRYVSGSQRESGLWWSQNALYSSVCQGLAANQARQLSLVVWVWMNFGLPAIIILLPFQLGLTSGSQHLLPFCFSFSLRVPKYTIETWWG